MNLFSQQCYIKAVEANNLFRSELVNEINKYATFKKELKEAYDLAECELKGKYNLKKLISKNDRKKK